MLIKKNQKLLCYKGCYNQAKKEKKMRTWLKHKIMDNTCDWLCSIPHSHGKYEK